VGIFEIGVNLSVDLVLLVGPVVLNYPFHEYLYLQWFYMVLWIAILYFISRFQNYFTTPLLKNPFSPSERDFMSAMSPRFYRGKGSPPKTRITYLTFYKSLVLIPTIASILAVDFPSIYPRKFVKCENYGYSLMDVGCAAVLFA
jgi:hypothetical protein